MTEIDSSAPELELIAALRAAPNAVSESARERVEARLATSIGAAVVGGAPLTASKKTQAARGVQSALGGHVIGVGVSFLLGALSGAAVYDAVRPKTAARVVYVDRVVAAATTVVVPEASSFAPENATTAASATDAPVAMPNGAAEKKTSLAEQQTLLDRARREFARGDFAATLGTLKHHSRLYPKSALDEERAALEIKALAGAGRSDEARARAARFVAQYPQSFLLPSVRESVGEIP